MRSAARGLVSRARRLVPLAEYNAGRGGLRATFYPRLNGIACPSCKGEMTDTEPPGDAPHVPVACLRCGYAYFRVSEP
jgi:hypothetical protein